MIAGIPPITYGVVGTQHGHLKGMIQELEELPGVTCAGVYDDETASAQAICDEFNLPLMDDKRRLFDNDAVSLIASAAVNADKGLILTEAVEAGKATIVDKPLVTAMADLDRLDAAVKAHDGHVGLMLTERYGWYGQQLKQLCDDGALGKIASFMAWRPHRLGRPTRPDWMFDYDRYGGIIVYLLIHDLDICRWITGAEFTEITAYEDNVANQSDHNFVDIGVALGRLSDGTTCLAKTDWLTPATSPVHGDCRYLVAGSEGTVEVMTAGDIFDNPKGDYGTQIRFLSNSEPPRLLDRTAESVPILNDVLSSIYLGTPSVISTSDAIESTRATLMAQQSVRDGMTIKRATV